MAVIMKLHDRGNPISEFFLFKFLVFFASTAEIRLGHTRVYTRYKKNNDTNYSYYHTGVRLPHDYAY